MANAAVTRNDGAGRLSVVEKVGYGLGDTAANFIFQTMVMFQLAFYTDVFGITAAAAGTLLVVVRVWDAIFDPIMRPIRMPSSITTITTCGNRRSGTPRSGSCRA